MCGISRGGSRKETWWNGDVKKSIEIKEKYKNWRKERCRIKSWDVQSRRNAQRIVAKAMNDKETEEALKIEEMAYVASWH